MRNFKVLAAVSSAVSLGLLATAANAAVTVAAGTANYGIEYSTAQAAGTVSTLWSNNTAAAAVDSPNWASDVSYLTGDVVTITLGGTANAAFSTSGLESATLVCDTNNDGVPAEAAVTAATSASTGTTYVFTLTGGCATGRNVFLVGADLSNASLGSAGTITLGVGVTRSGSTIDATATPGTVASVLREYDVTVAGAFDGQILHASNNRAFFAGASDDLTLTVVNNDLVGDTDSVASATGLTVTLTQDFQIVDDDGNGQCTNAELRGTQGLIVVLDTNNVDRTASATITSDCRTITVPLLAAEADMDAGNGGTVTIRVTAAAGAGGYLIPGTISGTATLAYVPDNSTATTRAPAIVPGAFSSGVSTVFVPWMPAGATTSQSLWITNNSNATGTVTVSGRNEAGVNCSSVQTGGPIAVGANRTVSLGNAIVNAITNCWGGFNVTQKFFLTLQTNLPDEAIEVFTQFNVGGSDRGFIMNSSNGRSPEANGMGSSNSTGRN